MLFWTASTAAISDTSTAVTSLGVVTFVVLVIILAVKEILGAVSGTKPKLLRKHLNIAIVPLLGVFFATLLAALSSGN